MQLLAGSVSLPADSMLNSCLHIYFFICMQEVDAVMVLLNIAEGTSRVHAGRRVFEHLHRQQNDIPVIHHRVFPAGGPLLPTRPP